VQDWNALQCHLTYAIEDRGQRRSAVVQKFSIFWSVTLCNLAEIMPNFRGKLLPPSVGQKTKGTSATSINCYHITRSHITEDGNIHSDSRGSFRSCRSSSIGRKVVRNLLKKLDWINWTICRYR
jgi:hypothetical protein